MPSLHDSPTLDAERETLIAFSIETLRGIIATAIDQKVKLDAVKELNTILALRVRETPRSAKQTNNFYGVADAAQRHQSVATRLNDAQRSAARAIAASATDALAVADVAAMEDELASLEDGDA